MSAISVQQDGRQKIFGTFQEALDYINKEREEGYKEAITITGHEFMPPKEEEGIHMEFKPTASTEDKL